MQTLRKSEDLPNALENTNRREERALKAELARMELNVPNGKVANEFGGKVCLQWAKGPFWPIYIIATNLV